MHLAVHAGCRSRRALQRLSRNRTWLQRHPLLSSAAWHWLRVRSLSSCPCLMLCPASCLLVRAVLRCLNPPRPSRFRSQHPEMTHSCLAEYLCMTYIRRMGHRHFRLSLAATHLLRQLSSRSANTATYVSDKGVAAHILVAREYELCSLGSAMRELTSTTSFMAMDFGSRSHLSSAPSL